MKKHNIKRIEGSNIILEPFSYKYVNNNYLSWMKDLETTKFIKKTKTNISLNDLLLFAKKMIDSNFDYFYAILFKKNLKHIGNVRLGPIDFKVMKSNFGILIGNKNFHGIGIGTEVLSLIKKFSFRTLKLKKITFPVVQKNIPAMGLYKKNGFVIKKNLKKNFIKNGKSWKLVEWEMKNPNIKKLYEKKI